MQYSSPGYLVWRPHSSIAILCAVACASVALGTAVVAAGVLAGAALALAGAAEVAAVTAARAAADGGVLVSTLCPPRGASALLPAAALDTLLGAAGACAASVPSAGAPEPQPM